MCSGWPAAPVCCDWSSVFRKCHAPFHNHEFQHTTNATPGMGGNYLNEEYCDVYVPGRKLKTTIEAFKNLKNQYE